MSAVSLTLRPTAPPGDLDLEALFRESAGDVHAYARTLLGDDAAAEDVTAVAFERAHRRRRRFDPRRGSARAWLFAIARNAALDELRRRRRSAGLVAELADDLPVDQDDGEAAARRTAVARALAELAPRERELIALRFHGGLSHAELGRVLSTSETSAATRVHRAMTKLREACDAQR